ncbi:flagellar basal body rod protein FlgB [Tumebacillus sp. ITR2]|uniref:Flagellar basal body rod protein FlgB n=1 Tax=Tumebacillus amylolyticus TaxID=2801339 RepID=A0ABS1JFB7_9BACL|nr:flagellar basal body rod protein FlgB [Tumebacillus amylolyticus]MBL0388905.1 flagellar basal body rod protein FlgB [Tumebacillus amylolyticus]
MSLLDSRSITLLERTLDSSSLRQKVLSNNIANIDTPNFKRSDVSFQDALSNAISEGDTLEGRTTDARHIKINSKSLDDVKPTVFQENSTSLRTDGNNVDIDAEMTNLAENQILYNAMTQQINSKFGLLKYAINEGKR